YVRDRNLDEIRLSKDPAIDRHAGRNLALQRLQLAIESPGHLDGVGAWLLLDTNDHRGMAAARAFAPLKRRSLTDVGHVADEPRTIASKRDGRFSDLLGCSSAPDGFENVLLCPLGINAGRRVMTG